MGVGKNKLLPVRILAGAVVLFSAALRLQGQEELPNNYRDLVQAGRGALEHNQLPEAARAFQKAVDLNPSSAEAHHGLGVALLRQLEAEKVRASNESDVSERAEEHLKQAAELWPSASEPLLDLAQLEALLAVKAPDEEQKTARFNEAREALKRVIALQPGKPEIYLRLATLERDEFGPALDDAKARYSGAAGPIPDVQVRKQLQQRYSAIVDAAIRHAQQASEMNGNSPRPLLLLSKMLRQRALLRDTQEQYAADMQTAADWERQFQVVGNHVDGSGR
jgi:tetratricopeptide (TPR) repeat protein